MSDKISDLEILSNYYNKTNILIADLENSQKVKIPSQIYHYTSLQAIYSILKQKTIRLTNCEFLNDNSEIIYIRKIISELLDTDKEINNFHSDSNFPQIFKDSVLKTFDEHIEKLTPNIFLLSLTESNHSLSMWSGYSDYDGYRITFDFEKIVNEIVSSGNNTFISEKNERVKLKNFTYAGKVIYSKKTQTDYLKNILLIFATVIYDLGNVKFDSQKATDFNKESISDIFGKIFAFAYICKDDCFEYENEHRIAITFDHKSSDRLLVEKFRLARGSLIPYIELDFTDPKHKLLPIEEIQIGPKINIDIAEKGLNPFLESSGYKKIIVTKSKIPLR
ncbi:DUF2971 domain-containing protein [Leptospira vanthielii]|uniref:PF11185 family protein n=1 Tax=Leptospira vanthielii serovar Holland str. Waz Holland = ATCC 700522 TaxID=1218591 RepID=N1W611_9LEPT|nr:DUF2971 domain-containing protein [Leptospira vanthielii]EMY71674.1 PF11185 family protein [Leptospira vanthielii serovar Holland str. Waz Holland = ATCC 700522]